MQYEKKVSICMIIKDEEKNLTRCLDSLVPILDSKLAELIIVDTGSSDNSIQIARKYTDKVYQHQWTNNFSEMRNISISYAKGEWIWIIDADEELENPEEAIEIIKQDLEKYNTVSIKMKNYMESYSKGKEPSYSVNNLIRMFRRTEEFKYEGSIHEQPRFEKPVYASNIIFRHYGYIWEDEEFTNKKFQRTAGLLKKELEKDPNNIYYQYQLALSTSIVDLEKGLNEYRKTYKLIKKMSYRERYRYLYIYGSYSMTAYRNQEYKEAIKICQEGLQLNKDYIDLWYTLFISNIKIGDTENVLKAGMKYLECKKTFFKSPISKDTSLTFYYTDDHYEDLVLYNMALIHIKKNDYDLAVKHATRIKDSDLKPKAMIKIARDDKNTQIVMEYFREIDQDEKRQFINLLESQDIDIEIRQLYQKQIMKYYEENNRNEPYYILNIIRQEIMQNSISNAHIIQKINKLDFDMLEDYYGDIIVYIINNDLELSFFQNIGDTRNVERMTIYAINKYSSFYNQIVNYLHKYHDKEDMISFRYWLTLARIVLMLEKCEDSHYMDLFHKYIDKGVEYINNIYNPDIYNKDMIYDIYNREHRFFIYIQKAKLIKEKNITQYIRYLRKALKSYPIKKGIDLLLEQAQEEIDTIEKRNQATREEIQNEFEEYKEIVKNNINILIKAKKFGEAKLLIDEYLKIVPDDLEMLTLKSEIQLNLM